MYTLLYSSSTSQGKAYLTPAFTACAISDKISEAAIINDEAAGIRALVVACGLVCYIACGTVQHGIRNSKISGLQVEGMVGLC